MSVEPMRRNGASVPTPMASMPSSPVAPSIAQPTAFSKCGMLGLEAVHERPVSGQDIERFQPVIGMTESLSFAAFLNHDFAFAILASSPSVVPVPYLHGMTLGRIAKMAKTK